jgi:hypothetical protein
MSEETAAGFTSVDAGRPAACLSAIAIDMPPAWFVEATRGIFGPHAETKAEPLASGFAAQRAHELLGFWRSG